MITLHAPAKLNLFLHVVDKRDDGYHALESLVTFADIGDVLTININGTGLFSVSGPFAYLTPEDTDQNLVTRARDFIAVHIPSISKWDIHLQKNIPVGAGLGGGSSDAAAFLNYVQHIAPELRDVVRKIADDLGSDIAASLHNDNKILCGRGEILKPHPPLPKCFAVLVWPNYSLSTHEVFKNFKLKSDKDRTLYHPLNWDEITKFGNDLTETACGLCPDITTAIQALQKQSGCHFARMTGSGSCVFGIFEKAEHAKESFEHIKTTYPEWWVRECVLG